MRVMSVLLAVFVAGCVNVDPQTGDTIPRGGQKHKMAIVERNAQQLTDGMTKYQALILLGSPAEASKDGDVWIYLPERPGVLVPSRALRLEFKNGRLVKHGYNPIVLGQSL